MPLLRFAGVLLALLHLAVPAFSQAAPSDLKPVDQSTWSPSSELVVRAPWPPMWRLQRGDSTLWVMATVTVMPVAQSWDSSRLKKLINHAKVVILPNGVGRYRPSGTRLPAGVSLKTVLPEPLYQRYEAMVLREGLSIETYSQFKPAWAGPFLRGATFKNHDLKSEIYPDYISVMAKAAKVPLRFVKIDRPNPHFDLNRLDKTTAEVCLSAYLDILDYNLDIGPKMAMAWSQSDVPAMLGYYRESPSRLCFPDTPAVRVERAYPIEQLEAAFDEALQTPGIAVAAVPLDWLLRKDGVLDRLKDKGVEIRAPAE